MTKLRAGVVGMALAGSIAMLAGSAAADGMDKPSMKDTHHHTPFTWTGFYGGLGVGYQTNKITGSFANAPAFFWDSGKQSGGIVGAQAGYQYQMGNLVLGVEGAYKSVMSPAFSSKLAGGAGAPCGFVANVQNCEGRMNDIFQVGGRLGFAVQNVLLYGTGGYALGNFETQGLTVANGQPFSSGSRNHAGAYFGAGLDYGITKNLVLGVEYNHYNFNLAGHFTPTSNDSRLVTPRADTIMARLNFKTN